MEFPYDLEIWKFDLVLLELPFEIWNLVSI